jgi:hypothetical protein
VFAVKQTNLILARPAMRLPTLLRAALLPALMAAACSIGVRRDLSAVPPGQIGFDDMCGLQEYFDAIEAKVAPPPRLVTAVDLEGASGNQVARGGRARFAFEGDFELKHLRRVLTENWKGLPPELGPAQRIDIEVKWSERAGVRRVVTGEDAELAVGSRSWGLPYQVCLSELLFGEPLYQRRRSLWGAPAAGAAPRPASDGAVDQAPRDGGAADAPAEGPDAAHDALAP